eukprot:scaffold423910_cov27-Prasinocladus_malaysianus.AAC.1
MKLRESANNTGTSSRFSYVVRAEKAHLITYEYGSVRRMAAVSELARVSTVLVRVRLRVGR